MNAALTATVRLLAVLGMFLAAHGAHAFKMESGSFRINATTGGAPGFTTQVFRQTYDVTPVVFILTTNQGSDSAVVRIRNVSTTQFEAVIVEAPGENGPHVQMDVQYFAIEPGRHTMTVLDQVLGSRSVTIEAGLLSTDRVLCVAPATCTNTFDTHAFTAPAFTGTPVVLAQLQSFVNGIAGVPAVPPQPFITASIDAVNAGGFSFAIDRHETTTGALTGPQAATESIGYVAIEADVTAADFTANNATALLVELETILVPATAPNAADGWNDGCNENIPFSKVLPTRLVMATKQTRRTADGGWLRRCNLTSQRVRVVTDEDVQADNERSKVEPPKIRDGVGLVVFSRDFFFDSNFVPLTGSENFKIEAAAFQLVPGVPTVITLRQFYEQAPAVFLLPDNTDPEPAAARVLSVTTDPVAGTTSFTAVLAEPPGTGPGGPSSEIHYIAADKGLYSFPDGTLMEVGEVSVTALQQNFGGTDSFQTVNLATAFPATPVVLTQITGDANNPAAPELPWLTVAYESGSTTAGSFRIALERSEVNAGGAVALPETVAYLAIEPGAIAAFVDGGGNTVTGEAQFTLLRGTSNAGWDDICFLGSYLGIPFLNVYAGPPIVVASEMSHFGGDGGWHRRCALTATHVRIAEDEDQFANAERVHTREETGLVAFSQPFDADFSLIAWWEMEEPIWNAGAMGQVVNTVGTTLHGTPVDDAQTVVTTPAFSAPPGSTCRYGVFDGRINGGLTPDAVEFGSPDLGFEDQLTLTAWVRWSVNPASGNPNATILRNSSSSTFGLQFSLNAAVANRVFEFGLATVGSLKFVRPLPSAFTAVRDVWYHLGAVYDGSEMRLYIDGTEVASTPVFGDVVPFNPARTLNIGKSTFSAAFFNDFAFTGLIDEVRIYRRALSSDELGHVLRLTKPCAVAAHDHYRLDHVGAGGGFGVTCEAEAVSVRAHDLGHNASAPPVGTVVTVTANPGDAWALGSVGSPGRFTDVGGGVATYEWDGTETEVELLLTQSTPAIVTFTVLDTLGRGIGAAEGPPLEFRDAILDFSPVGVQVAGKPETFTVQVIEDTGTGACQAATPPPGTVDFAFECFNPNMNCSGVTDGVVEGVTIAAFDAGSVVPGGGVSLGFDATSTATFQMQYNDAGVVSLFGRATAGTPPATFEGATAPFPVRPFGLRVDVTGNPPVTPAPQPADATRDVFTPAGEPFAVQVTPVRWEAADDLDNDGIADGHEAGENEPGTLANLGDNAVTVNYQTSGLVPDGRALLGSYLHRPTGGADPGLADSGADPLRVGPFAGAAATKSTLRYDEVGVIEIDAVQTGDYLAIGPGETARIRGVSGPVGRFIPGYFEIAPAGTSFELRNGLASQPWTCDFTYVGQPFEYAAPAQLTVSTFAGNGSPVVNYNGSADPAEDFFRFSADLAMRSYADVTVPAPLATLANPLPSAPGAVTVSDEDGFDGWFTLTLVGESFRYDKGAAPEIAFEPRLELTVPAADFRDEDGVCYPGGSATCNLDIPLGTAIDYVKADIAGPAMPPVEMRFGRLALDSASGSELQPLPLPMRAEYFADQGGGTGVFVPNADDTGCTVLSLSGAVRLTGNAGEQDGDTVVPLEGTGGTTRLVDPGSGAPPAPDPTLTAGLGTLLFDAPAPAGNSGYVDVRIDLSVDGYDWLRFDWDGGGAFDDDPTARASFGLFPGRRELIYIREPWD